MNLDYEVNGLDEAIEIRVRASRQFKEELQNILSEASLVALEAMRENVPDGDDNEGSLFASNKEKGKRTIFDSLDRDGIVYQPGAVGGGGYYAINVGAIDNPPDHLIHNFYGTRGYGFTKAQSQIKPFSQDNTPGRVRGRGNFGTMMALGLKGGGVMYRTKRRGQRPQQNWFTDAQRTADAFVAARVQLLNVDTGD